MFRDPKIRKSKNICIIEFQYLNFPFFEFMCFNIDPFPMLILKI